jgi:hypothetical protein
MRQGDEPCLRFGPENFIAKLPSLKKSTERTHAAEAQSTIMEEPRAIFGSPALWDSIFRSHESAFLAIEDLRAIAADLIAATRDSKQELVQVQSALTQLCSESMLDVLLLVGNNRGAGAMKIARGMFEISVTSEYLEKNPSEVHDYLNFGTVEAWRHIKTVEKYSPRRVSPDLMKQAEAEYDQGKQKFTNAKGGVQRRWTNKSLRQMAEEVGRLNIYEVAYGPASELHHMPFTGIIAHELDWSREALFIGHGTLMGTTACLFNVNPDLGAELKNRMQKAIVEFKYTQKQP